MAAEFGGEFSRGQSHQRVGLIAEWESHLPWGRCALGLGRQRVQERVFVVHVCGGVGCLLAKIMKFCNKIASKAGKLANLDSFDFSARQ